MIPISEPTLGSEELDNVVKCVKSGWISSQGAFVKQFEQEFADYIGVKYGVATSNGTAALHLALVALGIGKGDEIIVPTLTFIATANAVVYTGAKPVFVDSNPDYWCINPELIEEKVTGKTKAIMPVHLYGHPCDMEAIKRIADKHNLYIVEDAAEAHGARYKGKMVGSFGDIGCFSFYANKIITTGEGGMCLTDSEELANKMRILRDHGMNPSKRYWHDCVGFNYRMTNLQAAVGLGQLHNIKQIHKMRLKVAENYKHLLQGLGITFPPQEEWAKPVNWVFTILSDSKDRIIKGLTSANIEVRPMFYPIHIMPPYASSVRYPVAESTSRRGFSLPSSPTLSYKDIEYISEVVRENSVPTS